MKLDQEYNKNEFIDFLGNFLPNFNEQEEDIIISKQRCKKINKAQVLGGSESLDLQVLEVEHESENDPRISIATDAFKILADHWIHKALIIFKSSNSKNYRLSLLTISLDLNEKNKTVRKYSNARRYSFYLGPNAKINTPIKYLINKGKISDFEDLRNRFSLEVVNKDFYKEISRLFTKLVGGNFGSGKKQEEYKSLLALPFVADKSQTSLEFAVRLIGRVIFCWFLREKRSDTDKSLMPNELLSSQATKEKSDYYHKILEPIFFEVLNKPIKSRKEAYTNGLFNSIPYLNGGLFSPHDDDYFSYNENKQASYHNMVKVPDSWLQEFFEFLETYNFTIDENIAFDEELSIDPEMLGRIFENLLAEINPETGESARKSTGSYYTPRTIVDYMVDESLFAYLKEKTKIDDKKLRAIISYDLTDDQQFSLLDKEKDGIINALSTVKILDPACGSGAFPIGALQKIVFILQQTDPEGKKWFQQQIKNAAAELKRVIEREFENKNFDYIRKLGIIRENIFGVDIQPIATEISRLRCFLTLVVDEEVEDELENRGIEPLPNLDFKFVTANSLISLPSSSQANLFEDQKNIAELKSLRDQFFSSTNAERHQLKDEFKELQKKMLMRMIEMRGGDDLTQRLSMWDPFSHKVSPWFDPEWMFGTKDGFDIIIANPPYETSRSKGIDEYMKKFLQKHYETAEDKYDYYTFFIERASKLTQNVGHVCFITPSTYLLKPLSRKIRKYIISNFSIKNIVEFKGLIFGATVPAAIILFQDKKPTDDHMIGISYNIKTIKDFLTGKFLKKSVKQILFNKEPDYYINVYSDEFFVRWFSKLSMRSSTIKLGELAEIYNGIQTGDDKKYVSFEKKSSDWQRVLTGSDIQKYYKKWGGKYIYYKPELLHSNTRKEIFKTKTKIIIRQTSDRIIGAYDEEQYFTLASTFVIKQFNEKIDYKSLLAILNSKLFLYSYRNINNEEGRVLPQIKKKHIFNLPIKLNFNQKPFIDLVDKILAITKDDDYLENPTKQAKVRDYEKQIDQLVYKLYGLTSEEIKIIEG